MNTIMTSSPPVRPVPMRKIGQEAPGILSPVRELKRYNVTSYPPKWVILDLLAIFFPKRCLFPVSFTRS
jgi:hypothetical protein